MAFILYALDQRGIAVLILLPLILGVPVMTGILLAVYWGRCRNPLWAGSFGVLLMTCYYAGSWEISYRVNVVANGPYAIAEVQQLGGAPGLAGYFLFRCQLAGGFLGSRARIIEQIAFHGFEFGVLLAIGLHMGRRLAVRAYYEDYGRWAASIAFLFEPRELSVVLDVIRHHQWDRLDSIEKRSVSRMASRRGGMIFRIEYLPGSADQPAFVTVEGPRLRRLRFLLLSLPVLGQWTQRLVSQVMLDSLTLRDLSLHVGGFDLPSATTSTPSSGQALGYWSADRKVLQPSPGGALGSMARETGFVGATLVGRGADFRDPAVAATASIIGYWPRSGLEGIEGVDSSLCSRAEQSATSALKNASRLDLCLSYGFALGSLSFFAGTVGAAALANAGHPVIAALTAVGTGCLLVLGVSGLLFQIFALPHLQKWMLTRRFSRRLGSLLSSATQGAQEVIRIEDATTWHISKATPEDWGICVLDSMRRRLLIEGISHRYVIRSSDVTLLRPCPRGASTSVFLNWKVGSVEVHMVLNRYSMGRVLLWSLAQQPVLGLLFRPMAGRGGEWLARRLGNALKLDPQNPTVAANSVVTP